MCSTGRIMDPLGIMNSKYAKIADPLGLQKTAIGDPTGRFRKEAAKDASGKAAAAAAAARPGMLRQQMEAANRNRQILTYQPNQPNTILGGS